MPTRRRAALVVDGHEIEGIVDDLSSSGMRMAVPAAAVRALDLQGGLVTVRTIPFPGSPARDFQLEVRSTRVQGQNVLIGLQFAPRSQEEREHAFLLFYGNADEWRRFLAARRKHVGVVKGIFLFLRLSLYYAVYSLRFVARTWGRRGTIR